jgi:hypothetical protein
MITIVERKNNGAAIKGDEINELIECTMKYVFRLHDHYREILREELTLYKISRVSNHLCGYQSGLLVILDVENSISDDNLRNLPSRELKLRIKNRRKTL